MRATFSANIFKIYITHDVSVAIRSFHLLPVRFSGFSIVMNWLSLALQNIESVLSCSDVVASFLLFFVLLA